MEPSEIRNNPDKLSQVSNYEKDINAISNNQESRQMSQNYETEMRVNIHALATINEGQIGEKAKAFEQKTYSFQQPLMTPSPIPLNPKKLPILLLDINLLPLQKQELFNLDELH